jgi:hypothetical protein
MLGLADSLMSQADPSRMYWTVPQQLAGLTVGGLPGVTSARPDFGAWWAARTRLHELNGSYVRYGPMRVLLGDDITILRSRCFASDVAITGGEVLAAGNVAQYNASVTALDGSSQSRVIRWSTTDSSIVGIDSLTGLATAKRTGDATIEARLHYGLDGVSSLVGRKSVRVVAALPDLLGGVWYTIVEAVKAPFTEFPGFCRARWTISAGGVVEDRDRRACNFMELPGFSSLTMRVEVAEMQVDVNGVIEIPVLFFEGSASSGETVCHHPSIPGLCYSLVYRRVPGSEPTLSGTSWVHQPHTIYLAQKSDEGVPWGTPW